jgi:hypothetical protein
MTDNAFLILFSLAFSILTYGFGFWCGYSHLLDTDLKHLRSQFLLPIYQRAKRLLEERGDL